LERCTLTLKPKQQRLTGIGFVLLLGAACSSSLDNRPAAEEGADPLAKYGQGKIRFRNPDMAARYQAAKANPKQFEPVFEYVRAVTDAATASLVQPSCETCGEGALRYKRRSELEPHYWPIIEDALGMLETLGGVAGLTADQMDQLTATKGRLLWLAGRSMEEQNLIDDYAHAHSGAVAVIRRRLERLREDGDTDAIVSQCTRSRAKTTAAPEATRLDLLTACVAFHPENAEGRSDLVDYAKYLPNLTPAEDMLYRTNLAQRCMAKVGDEGSRCTEACACEDADSGKAPTAKCKRACGGCRSETAEKLQLCKKLGEAPPPPPVAKVPRTKRTPANAATPKSAPAKVAPAKREPKSKGEKPGAEQQVVL
jgi:hypothetical protein